MPGDGGCWGLALRDGLLRKPPQGEEMGFDRFEKAARLKSAASPQNHMTDTTQLMHAFPLTPHSVEVRNATCREGRDHGLTRRTPPQSHGMMWAWFPETSRRHIPASPQLEEGADTHSAHAFPLTPHPEEGRNAACREGRGHGLPFRPW